MMAELRDQRPGSYIIVEHFAQKFKTMVVVPPMRNLAQLSMTLADGRLEHSKDPILVADPSLG
jgi:hypothetical protein